MINVQFFGDHTTAVLGRRYIMPFKSYEPQPTKGKLFNQALSEAKQCVLPDDKDSKLKALALECRRMDSMSLYHIDRIM